MRCWCSPGSTVRAKAAKDKPSSVATSAIVKRVAGSRRGSTPPPAVQHHLVCRVFVIYCDQRHCEALRRQPPRLDADGCTAEVLGWARLASAGSRQAIAAKQLDFFD